MFCNHVSVAFPILVRHTFPVFPRDKFSNSMVLFSCSNRSLPQSWETLSKAKAQILDFVTSPHTSTGVKLAALKFMQRVILVQTRGVSDPRVRLHTLSCL